MGGVLLVVMPFAGVERPQVGVSTLKARLRADGVPCDVAYLNLPFAAALGYGTYQWLTGRYDYSVLAGEWVFAETLFSRRAADEERYVRDLLAGQARMPPERLASVLRARELARPFLDHLLSAMDWRRYSVVGFTSTFEQNVASLALARRIKDRHPATAIVFGGGNCSGEMGRRLHRTFPWVDYVFTGEADLGFPELVRRLGSGAPRAADIGGCVRREHGRSFATPQGPALRDLDSLPYPDYDDYFYQRGLHPGAAGAGVLLQVETSRGCWWGAKRHCTFCGLSRDEMPFRSKTPERALAEIEHLSRRYGVKDVGAVDNILDMRFFHTLLPALERRRLGVRLFWETKSNLRREQVELLRDAGVATIQPGIESLSRHTLELMRKGTTPLQNVQLLKWCAELGVTAHWNVLYGFPGERAEDYRETLRIMGALGHIPPAGNAGPMRLDRYSPYFEQPEQFGIRVKGALPAYGRIYPFDEETLLDLAYFFEFDFDGKDEVPARAWPLHLALEDWKARHPYSRLEVVHRAPGLLLVADTRDGDPCVLRLAGPEVAVLDGLASARTRGGLERRLATTAPAGAAHGRWLDAFLSWLVERRLVVREGEQYLSVVLEGRAVGERSAPGAG